LTRTQTIAASLIGGSLIVAELGALFGPYPLRVAAGLVLVLVLPGLAATRALHPRGRTEQLLLIPGLSLSISILVGLIAYAANFRLTTGVWAVALGLATIAGLVAGFKPGSVDEGRAEVGYAPLRGGLLPRPPSLQSSVGPLLVVAGCLATALAVVVAINGQRHAPTPGFTELWAIRTHTGKVPSVALGVRSHEWSDTRYRLRISVPGRAARVQSIQLRPGQSWQRREKLGTSKAGVTVTLTKLPGHLAYRHVHLAPA
jgi:uncharacterized membrane protein